MRKKYLKQNVNQYRDDIKQMYLNKYYNYFLDSWKWPTLDKIQSDYIMRKFWCDGTVAAFKIKNTEELAFTTYAVQKFNMYDWPEQVLLINKWNVPFMPKKIQTVNKDVVLGWYQSNHKPARSLVENYINRIVNVEMVINTNLTIHKLPWVVGISEQDKDKANDILRQIMNDETYVFADLKDLQLVKTVASSAPYIIANLYQYKISLENELLTFLGVDNNQQTEEGSFQLVDQVNANNAIINLSSEGIKSNLEEFCNLISETLNVYINVEPRVKPVQSVYDGNMDVRGEGQNDAQE